MNTERELRRLIRKSMREFKRTQTTCIEPGCKTITLHDRCDRHRATERGYTAERGDASAGVTSPHIDSLRRVNP
jgi:hypothetical protein